MGSRRLTLAGLASGLALLGASAAPGPAFACVPASPLPGETAEAMTVRLQAEHLAFQQRDQRDLWARADHVFIARVVSPYKSAKPKPASLTEVVTRFEAVSALKGAAPARRFRTVQPFYMESPCYRGPFRDAFGAQKGDLLLVFVKGPDPVGDAILQVMAFDRVADPDLKAALDKARAAR